MRLGGRPLPCPRCAGPAAAAPALSTVSSMSQSLVLCERHGPRTCVHVRVRGACKSCLISVLCGQVKVGLFYSLCVSPCLFFIPSSSSSHSAINPNSHLSDQREGWSFSLLTHLQFARRGVLLPVGTSRLVLFPQARSSQACPFGTQQALL